jgi:PAS domain S-box-containing protein
MENTGGFFDIIYKQAQHNAIIIINSKGIMMECNKAFTDNYGYTNHDIKGQNFEILFTPHDRLMGKPQNELESTLNDSVCNDDNYLVAKNGTFIWATGESIRVDTPGGETVLVKIVHDIDAQKQLERFLLESEDFLDNIFHSAKNVALMTLDGNLKILRTNDYFLQFFDLDNAPKEGDRLADFDHPFWNDPSIKGALRDSIVQGKPASMSPLLITNTKGKTWQVTMKSKLIEHVSEKRLLVVVQESKPNGIG